VLLHAEPAPLLPAAAWLGRLSAAPFFVAAVLPTGKSPLGQPVLLLLGRKEEARGPLDAHDLQRPKTFVYTNPAQPRKIKKDMCKCARNSTIYACNAGSCK
jgi:hypothetical protein